MTDSATEDRHELAQGVASEAGRCALDFWQNRDALEIEAKGGAQNLVSEADRTIERLVRERVSRSFPADGFLGEEYGYEPGTSGFIWVIDPIDGTSPFLHGMPNWCVAVALLKDGRCVSAVTEVPTNRETFSAVRGDGTRVNGNSIRISPDLKIGNGILGLGASAYSDPKHLSRRVERLLEAGGMFYRNGSGALMLAYVAAGRLVGYFETVMFPWDSLGGLLMIREAGGRTRELAHDPTLSRRECVLAGAPGAWDDLQALFSD